MCFTVKAVLTIAECNMIQIETRHPLLCAHVLQPSLVQSAWRGSISANASKVKTAFIMIVSTSLNLKRSKVMFYMTYGDEKGCENSLFGA